MELVVSHLKKNYGRKEVLKDIEFRFQQGKIYALLGRNGAGKTTFFSCLNRDIKTDGGQFYLEKEGKKQELTVYDIGFLPSQPMVPDFLTANEFVHFFLDIHKKELDSNIDVDSLFEKLQIEPEDRQRLMRDFSHGMKNKMQMLIHMILNPLIYLLDEPMTSLDLVVSEEMKMLLRSQKEEHITIFSTHILDLALDLCDEILLLHRGRIEQINRENLNDTEMREKILAVLQEEKNA